MAPALEEDFASSPPATATEGEESALFAAANPATSPSNKEDGNEDRRGKPDGEQSQPSHSHSVAVGTSSSASPKTSTPHPQQAVSTSTFSSSSSCTPAPSATNEDEKRPTAAGGAPPPTCDIAGQGTPHSSSSAAEQEHHPPAAAPSTRIPSSSPASGGLSQDQEEETQKAPMKPPPVRIVYDLPSAPPPAPVAPGSGSSCYYSPPAPNIMGDMVEGSVSDRLCRLDAADSHIDLDISPDGLRASCLHTDGFQYTWKGVRTTYGVSGNTGQYYFEVKVVGCPAVVMPETPPSTQNICRIGVSQPFSSLFLGESGESWGFGGTAKKSHARKFEDYGQTYGMHDVIGVIIDLQNLKLSFSRNGSFLGTAYTLPPRVRDTGLFPHLYLKNVDVQVNFRAATAWFPPPNKQIQFIGDLPPHALLPNGVEHPRHVGECEFIMMVGLPACGKTYWAERHCQQHPAKSYVLLGTNAVIDQMRVMGVKRQANYASRWEELMSTATAIFNGLVERAGSGVNPRNIIIDQTNVYRNARRRKVQPFLAWGIRRAVTIVNDEYTLQQRTHKREQEEGKFVPIAAVKEMQAAFCLPQLDDGFTVIDYPELPEMESRQQVRRYAEEGRRFKRENPNVTGNQAKPHMEKRRPEEFLAAAELYPEKKRGRFSNDDQQQPQQYHRGGGGGGGNSSGGPGVGGGGGWVGVGDGGAGGVGGGGGGGGLGGGRGGGVGTAGRGRGEQQQQWAEQQQMKYTEGGGRHLQRQHPQQQQNYTYHPERGGGGQQQQWGWQQDNQQQQQEGARTVGYCNYYGQGKERNGNAPPRYEYQSNHRREYYASVSSGNAYAETHYDAYTAGNRGDGREEGYQQTTVHGAAAAGRGGTYHGGDDRSRRGGYQQPHGETQYFEEGSAAAAAGAGRGRSYYYVESSSYAVRSSGPTGSSEQLVVGAAPPPAPAASHRGGDVYYPSPPRPAGGGPGDYATWKNSATAAAAGQHHAYAGNAPRHGGGVQQQQQQQTWNSGSYRGGRRGGGGAGAAGGGPGRRF